MKKLLTFLFAFVLIAVLISGCNESTMTCETLSDNISSKLDKLTMSVTKLDTIDNQYIANPDIYPTTKSVTYLVPNPTAPKQSNLPINENEAKIVKNIIAGNNLQNDNLLNTLQSNLYDNFEN